MNNHFYDLLLDWMDEDITIDKLFDSVDGMFFKGELSVDDYMDIMDAFTQPRPHTHVLPCGDGTYYVEFYSQPFKRNFDYLEDAISFKEYIIERIEAYGKSNTERLIDRSKREEEEKISKAYDNRKFMCLLGLFNVYFIGCYYYVLFSDGSMPWWNWLKWLEVFRKFMGIE